MAKAKKVFICRECGNESAKWQGRCPDCGNWNTFEEVGEVELAAVSKAAATVADGTLTLLSDCSTEDEHRYATNISELDRVLGGGIVKGSLILLGGEPGIGKSTLLLQICSSLDKNLDILYVSGEESLRQIKLRADRLGVNNEKLYLLSHNNISAITSVIAKNKPQIVIIDSIQTMSHEEVSSAPGSVTQVRECTMELMKTAKSTETAVLLIGHVNKEGALAGPKVLEHIVDAVLYFEGDRQSSYRILRAEKNRFGSTNEIGVFEMQSTGLCQVENPSQMLLDGRPDDAPGICTVCLMEGTRPIMTEAQALAATSNYAMPKRTAIGIDHNKVSMLIAVLEKRAGVKLLTQDVYVNIIGGLRSEDPASDLPILLAIASSAKDKVISDTVIAMGEVGLAGEVRAVSNIDVRVSEAIRLGFKTILIPQNNKLSQKHEGAEILRVRNIREALALLL